VGAPSHPGDDQRATSPVQSGGSVSFLTGDVDERAGHRECGERDVHVEAPSPGLGLGEDATQNHPESTAGSGDGTEDPERPAPIRAVGEGLRQDCERGGGEHGPEHPLGGAGNDQHVIIPGSATESGCGGEADQPGDEHGSTAPEA